MTSKENKSPLTKIEDKKLKQFEREKEEIEFSIKRALEIIRETDSEDHMDEAASFIMSKLPEFVKVSKQANVLQIKVEKFLREKHNEWLKKVIEENSSKNDK